MGAAGGPNMVEDGMVFYYDTGNATRSYKGKPTSNLLETDANWLYVGNTITDPSNYPVALPRNVKFYTGGSNNGISWTDACKNFTDSYSAGTQITVSGWHMFYSTDTSLSMNSRDRLGWHYNKDGTSTYGGTIHTATEWNKWYYFSNTFSSTGVTTTLRVEDGGADYYRSSEDAAKTTQYYCNLQIEIGDGIVSPYVKGARSVSGSLLDMTGNSTIDLTNVSFDSNAQMTFDGTSDTIALGNSSTFNITSEMSVSAWIRPDSISGWKGIFGGATSGFVHFQLYNGGINVYVYGPAAAYGNPDSVSIGTNVWTNVGFTFGNNTLKVYLNGEQLPTTVTGNGANITGNSDVRIGWSYATSRLFQGSIKALTVYNRALTAGEVKNNFNGIKKRFGI